METKQQKSPPNPDRFKEFRDLPDGSGFELPTGEKFLYEEEGGWFDEFGNYYNKDGVPVELDSEEEYEDEEEEEFKEKDPIKNPEKGEYENYEDEFIKEYELGFKENEENKEEHDINEDLEKKIQEQKELDAEFTLKIANLVFNIEEEKVLAFFKKELGDKFKYRKITMNKSKGIGEITVNSKEIADLLYSLNGKKLEGRDIHIDNPSKKAPESNKSKKNKEKPIFNTQFYSSPQK